MKYKKVILISIIGLFIFGFFSLYSSLDTNFDKNGERDNYFNYTLKRVVPQNIKDYIKNFFNQTNPIEIDYYPNHLMKLNNF